MAHVPSADEARVRELVEELLATHPPQTTPALDLLGAQFDMGLAFVHFPVGDGGLGLPAGLQRVVAERVAAARAPSSLLRNFVGLGMCAPTLAAWGTPAQRARYLRPLFTGEEIWCQLFSEPGAGSDVAGLATRAVRDGDEWVVNGEKVWTTMAHVARWGLLLARTDPEVVKHAGLTAFVVDMHAPGVEVRPLRQITGEAEFSQVSLIDVRIPAAQVLGRPGDGWRVALTTLSNERSSLGSSGVPRNVGPIVQLLRLARSRSEGGRGRGLDPGIDRVVALWIRSEVVRLTNRRAAAARRAGDPGPEGAIAKCATAELNKAIHEAIVDLLGAEGMLYGSYAMVRPEIALAADSPQKAFLRSRASSIEGGTTEVMKNILAERALGLPAEPRPDRELPWSQVPRG